METSVAVRVGVGLSENGFSLDELVFKVKTLFETNALPCFIAFVLGLVDDALYLVYKAKGYVTKDIRTRSLRTSAGTVKIKWRRMVREDGTGLVVPLRDFLGIEAYQRKTSELERIVAETVSEQSYRRSVAHLDTIGSIAVPKSTMNRWIMETDCAELSVSSRLCSVWTSDGTKFKKQPEKKGDGAGQGDLRVLLGITKGGDVLPLGSWTGLSWDGISKDIRRQTKHFGKLGDILVSDGEEGLANALSEFVDEQQRCHWHMTHDLGYTMWEDGAPLAERKGDKRFMAGLLGIELPAGDFQKVPPEKLTEIDEAVRRAEGALDRLVGEFDLRGYHRAARYVENARDKLFRYVRFWMRTGLICPRASSMIERMMRELARRLKRMAHNWSDAGAGKIARIILKKALTWNEWDDWWRKKMRLEGKVHVRMLSVGPA